MTFDIWKWHFHNHWLLRPYLNSKHVGVGIMCVELWGWVARGGDVLWLVHPGQLRVNQVQVQTERWLHVQICYADKLPLNMLTRVVREVPTFLLAHVSIRLNTYRHVRSKTRSTPQTPSLTRTRTQIKVQFSNSKSHVALATVVLLGVGVCVSQEECWMMKSGREQKVLQQKPSENDSPATTFSVLLRWRHHIMFFVGFWEENSIITFLKS